MTHRRIITTILMALLTIGSTAIAQTDKAEADRIVFQMLSNETTAENWHPSPVILSDRVRPTAEEGLYVVKGDTFQVRSISSDYYVVKKDGQWTPVNDGRYPLETMVNLMLDRLANNQHQLELRHHQYGGNIPRIIIPMQRLYDLLARNMQLYCSVTHIDKDKMRAVLVFHQERLDFIHMLELKTDPKKLIDPQSTIAADLYTNIPQGNLKNIYGEKPQK